MISAGERFEKLVAVEDQYRRKRDGVYFVKCLCDCGNSTVVRAAKLTTGHTRSCGCLVPEAATRHGQAGTPEYITWRHMIQRCHDAENQKYPIYGGRGISVCKRWRESVLFFIEDMGRKPGRGYTIERINNDGNYEPGNCRWATKREQSANTRRNIIIEHDGEALCLSEWSRKTGIPQHIIYRRHHSGLSSPDILRPCSGDKLGARVIYHDGRGMAASRWSKVTGIPSQVISNRISRGWSPERALTTPVRSR